MDNQKTIVFVHGAETFATYDEYLDWLRTDSTFNPERDIEKAKRWHKQLEIALPHYRILRPSMPNDRNAHYEEWEIYFEKVLPYLHNETSCIGHSLGGNFLAKFFSSKKHDLKLRQLHLVGACFGVTGTDFLITEDLALLATFFSEIHIHHSLDDSVVSYDDALKFSRAIPDAHLHTYKQYGHFLVDSFPELCNFFKQ